MKLAITNLVILIFISSNLYGQTWTLEQCIDSAYANNKKIALAENNQELTVIKHKEIKANLLPKVSINGDYKYFVELPYQLMPQSVFGGPEGQFKETQFGVPHNINANLMLQAPLYSSSLMGNINKLKTSKKIVALQVQKTYEQIYFEVTNIYRNAQLLKSQMIFIDSTILNTLKVKSKVELLAKQKLANQSDVKKIELKISTLQLYYSSLEVNLQQAINALKLLTGSPSTFDVEDNLQLINIEQYTDNGSKDVDIIKLQQELVSIDLKTLKRSKYLPEVGVVASYGTQGFGYDESPNQFLDFYPIAYAGIRLSYPIFNGTVTNKKIHQKNLELKNLMLKENLTQDAQNIAVENAVLRLENAFQNVTLSEQHVDLAQSIYTQEEKKYKEGLISINDLLMAQNELIQNKQNNLQRIAEFLAADLEFKKITNNIPKK